MDYSHTAELYQKLGEKKRWENTPEFNAYKGELDWYDKVKSKRNNDYFQAQDLINRQLVDPEWTPPHVDKDGKPLQYPVKYVNSVIRRKLTDGTEWLTSRQRWISLDEAGNPIDQSMDDKEMYDDILPIYSLRPEDKKSRDSKMIREITSIQSRIKYTLPFTKENAQKLWDMRNGNCTLVIKDESKDSRPYSIESFEAFSSRGFDDLMEWASTPRWKLDRSARDNLDDTGVQ